MAYVRVRQVKMPEFLRFPVAVVGAGSSGRAAIRLLKQWTPDKIPVFDDKAGVVSPGYPLSKPWIRDFVERGGVVTSELALAVESLTIEKVIAVTGSLGKSTTVSLIGEGALAVDPFAFVGGNLGVPLAEYVADVLEGIRTRAQWVVLELSSYQLECAGALRPEVSAFTYLSPNHLERYDSLGAYYATKWTLARCTRSAIVLNENGGDLLDYAQRHPEPADVRRIVASGQRTHPDARHSRLVGFHNRDNFAVAWSVAEACGWATPQALERMLKFGGLPHRIERLGDATGITFINDSKATSMDSVLTAVRAVVETVSSGHAWVLLGGRDKKLPWEQLSVLAQDSRLRFVFFGECRALACSKSGLQGPEFEKLSLAVEHVRAQARSGDVVLLSPGGTSLDEFKGFEDRGRRFREMILEIFGGLS